MPSVLEDGARIAVLGGGPAGSLSAYFLLTFAQRMDLSLEVDVYEPRDFTKPGPAGCNMCGGIVSESLIQFLAAEGINLPTTVVQRGIDSYVLHSGRDSVRIDTPLLEKRIAAVHRGGGPRDVRELTWKGLDGHLLGLATQLGARVVTARVQDAAIVDGRPQVKLKDSTRDYDLLIGATGVNSSGWDLFQKLGLPGPAPKTTRTYITELNLGGERISQHFGNSMHVFLINLPHLDCAAMIPKGDFLTVCLLGSEIDKELIDTFFHMEAVKRLFPEDFQPREAACHCSPKINVAETAVPFVDRVVLVGDCGATRLYKDGLGAAYRTAKAAARTAVFSGVSARDFRRHYLPVYRSICADNGYGKLIFAIVHMIKAMDPLVDGTMRMVATEQSRAGAAKRMSTVLWDLFTGSAPYRDAFFSTLDPRFWTRFVWESLLAATSGGRSAGGGAAHGGWGSREGVQRSGGDLQTG